MPHLYRVQVGISKTTEELRLPGSEQKDNRCIAEVSSLETPGKNWPRELPQRIIYTYEGIRHEQYIQVGHQLRRVNHLRNDDPGKRDK